jgi:hypothetical protein
VSAIQQRRNVEIIWKAVQAKGMETARLQIVESSDPPEKDRNSSAEAGAGFAFGSEGSGEGADTTDIPEPTDAGRPTVDSAVVWEAAVKAGDTPGLFQEGVAPSEDAGFRAITEILDEIFGALLEPPVTEPCFDEERHAGLGQQEGTAKEGEGSVSGEDKAELLREKGLALIAQIAEFAERPAQLSVATALLQEIGRKLEALGQPSQPEGSADHHSLKQAFDRVLDQSAALPNKLEAKRLLEEHAEATMARIAEVEMQHSEQAIDFPKPGIDYAPFPGRTDAYIWLRESPWAKLLKHFSPDLEIDLATQADIGVSDPAFMKALRGQSRIIKERHGLSISDFVPTSRWNNTQEDSGAVESSAADRIVERLRYRARSKRRRSAPSEPALHR